MMVLRKLLKVFGVLGAGALVVAHVAGGGAQ